MDKIFHVFVSSTYTDLIDARRSISEAVAKAGYVAEGMEIFPASSQRQMDFIKSVIDRCDYYILVIGGRYGSRDKNGISYTELEFEYAKEKGLPILAFLRNDLDNLPIELKETDAGALMALTEFRKRIMSDTLVDFWNEPHELATKALAALSQSRQTHPGIGWLRANHAASEEVLNEINTLRKQNDSLKFEINNYKSKEIPIFENLADFSDKFVFRFTHKKYQYTNKYDKELELTWKEIFRIISPSYRTISNTVGIENSLSRYIKNDTQIAGSKDDVVINMSDKEKILLQFEAMRLLESGIYNLKNGGSAVFHKLSGFGQKIMLELNAVYKDT